MSINSSARVKVNLPEQLRSLVRGEKSVEITAEPPTLGAAVTALSVEYPGFSERLLRPNGELNRFVNVYISDEDCRFLGGLAASLEDNQEITIIAAVAGG